MLRLETLTDQMVGSIQNAVEGDLGIQCAATPHDAVFNDGFKSGLFPLVFVHRHHIIVCHQNCCLTGSFTGPLKQQAAVRQLAKIAG